MTASETLSARVRCISWEAEGILGFELVPWTPGGSFPAVEAGAHIDLHLGNGLVRSYSLLNAPGERHRYCIAVNNDPASRGGSRWLHEKLRCGEQMQISAPRNAFALDETASHSVLIGGGIGITPLLSMVRRLNAIGRPWTLHYSVRSRARAAYAAELQALAAQAREAGRQATLVLHVDDEQQGRFLDVAAALAAAPEGAHAYCCGPQPMLAAFEAATASWPPARVHREYFASNQEAATSGGFVVELARRGTSITVQPGQTILDGLIAIGAEPPNSCRQGICGTCEVAVLAGEPDHRDLVLSEEDRAANQRIIVCCSGAKSSRLVLDL